MPLKNDNISNNVIVCFGFVFVLFVFLGGGGILDSMPAIYKRKKKKGQF